MSMMRRIKIVAAIALGAVLGIAAASWLRTSEHATHAPVVPLAVVPADPHAGHGAPPATTPPATTPPATTPPAATHAGHDMTPVDVTNAKRPPDGVRPGQDLASRMVADVRQFDLAAEVVRWDLLPGVEAGAYAYNQQVPGPTIRVKPGERIRVAVANRLPEPTTIHWHGLDVPVEQDGVHLPGYSVVAPGGTHSYEFTVQNAPGTFFYHTHFAADRQQALGLYGALVIEGPPPVPVTAEHLVLLGEWRIVDGKTYPAMQMDGMMPNYFTLNGKSYPATETIKAKVGDRLLFRLVGSGQFIHPIHIHGGPFEIVATDGHPVPAGARLTKDTVLVGPGERYDVLWTALRPGRWMLHCHINHHVTNDGAETDGAGGMTMIIDVET